MSEKTYDDMRAILEGFQCHIDKAEAEGRTIVLTAVIMRASRDEDGDSTAEGQQVTIRVAGPNSSDDERATIARTTMDYAFKSVMKQAVPDILSALLAGGDDDE